ncbi:MAG: YtxH domain-containing protein [Bacillota bacterium]|nr:YtxH domain-containing protein [Bacillota bacterium]MDI7249855.1 YtxH domain-containing protein [Bacillota bacterium]
MAESRFWEGFLIGGLVGLAAGLLFAPQSGAESRRLVMEKGREVADATARGYQSAAARVGEAARTVREAVSRGREVAVEVTSELTEQAEQN